MSGTIFQRAVAVFKEVLWIDDPAIETNSIEAMSQRKKAGLYSGGGNTSVITLSGGPFNGQYRFFCRSIDTVTLEDTDGFKYHYQRSGPNNFVYAEKVGAQ